MYEALKELILASGHTVVFTGAGVSTLSGIRDFRGAGGFYTATYHGRQVEDLLSIDLFRHDPSLFYEWARQFVYNLDDYRPSVVHTVLATMEKRNLIHAVYTQNIDMLHQKAGSEKVREVHGSPAGHRCLSCGSSASYDEVAPQVRAGSIPRCRQCDGVMKPDIVFYGEQLDNRLLDQAYRDMAASDLVLVLGSSLTVQPAASLPMATYYHGGKMVIVNAQETPLDKYAKLRLYDLRETCLELERWLGGSQV